LNQILPLKFEKDNLILNKTPNTKKKLFKTNPLKDIYSFSNSKMINVDNIRPNKNRLNNIEEEANYFKTCKKYKNKNDIKVDDHLFEDYKLINKGVGSNSLIIEDENFQNFQGQNFKRLSMNLNSVNKINLEKDFANEKIQKTKYSDKKEINI
jgi:hypothetical protein